MCVFWILLLLLPTTHPHISKDLQREIKRGKKKVSKHIWMPKRDTSPFTLIQWLASNCETSKSVMTSKWTKDPHLLLVFILIPLLCSILFVIIISLLWSEGSILAARQCRLRSPVCLSAQAAFRRSMKRRPSTLQQRPEMTTQSLDVK